MSNIKFIFDNAGDTATLTPPSGEVATLPVGNLQLPGRSNILRTTTLTAQSILGDFAVPRFVDGFALAHHNFSSQATVRFRLWDAAGQTGTLLYDSGVLQVNPAIAWGVFQWGLVPWGQAIETNIFALFFDVYAAASFQIDFDDAVNPDSYIDIGRLFIGKHYAPSVGVDYGMTHEYKDSSTQTRTDGGTLRTEVGQTYAKLTIPLNFLNPADRDNLSVAARDLGKRIEFLVSAYPDATGQTFVDYTFVGKFTEIPRIQNTFHKYFAANLVAEES